MRWALIEAIQRVPRDSVIGAVKDGIIARRGKEAKNIAKVAAARRLLILVFYGMRDGQIRCLPGSAGQPPVTQPPARAAWTTFPGQRPGARSPVCLPRHRGLMARASI